MRKCEECGEEYELEETVSAVEDEFDGEIEMEEEFECLCPECVKLRIHNYMILGSDAEYGSWL